ncbi:hypothetical protein DYI25_15745 [Mesobacillus boroniphilus]|uniref:Uncharacterized protein n=1 Tax=Mesobacillus boroniphilus TaxID=308892 RepID=A0A944CNK0_9BACI|nr:hypothetical protein [Mesobacillus boroniphilus]MBS8265880.1 hypothetical protein [Mesobacillus boroniphilus]
MLDIERFGTGYRWIYRIDKIDAESALSDWVLGIDAPCLDFIGEAFISEVFTGDDLADLIPLDEVTSGETFENPGTAPDPCPEGSPCSEGLRVTGFKFDDLGTEQPEGLGFLEAGSS